MQITYIHVHVYGNIYKNSVIAYASNEIYNTVKPMSFVVLIEYINL